MGFARQTADESGCSALPQDAGAAARQPEQVARALPVDGQERVEDRGDEDAPRA